MVLAPGRRRGASALLLHLWPPRLRSHCRLAAVGTLECRLLPIGPGADGGTGTCAAGDSGGEPGDPTAATPYGKLGTAALLCRPERGVRQGARSTSPADRRLAVVRSGFL